MKIITILLFIAILAIVNLTQLEFSQASAENKNETKFSMNLKNGNVSFEPVDDWNTFLVSGIIPSLQLDLNSAISFNDDASASFVIFSFPKTFDFMNPTYDIERIFSSILSSPFLSPYLALNNDSYNITFGNNNYLGTVYPISINEEQVNNIKQFIPLIEKSLDGKMHIPIIEKPLDGIIVTTEQDDNIFFILFFTGYYPEDSYQMDIYGDEFLKILDSIKFEFDSIDTENNINNKIDKNLLSLGDGPVFISISDLNLKNNSTEIEIDFELKNESPNTFTLSKIEYDVFADNQYIGYGELSYEDIPLNGRPEISPYSQLIIRNSSTIEKNESNQEIVDKLNKENELIKDITFKVNGEASMESVFMVKNPRQFILTYP